MRRFILRFLQFLAFALFATVGWGLWHLHTRGFSQQWRAFVAAELRKSGIEVRMRQLTLHPLKGVVAREVRVLDPFHQGQTLAVVDEIVLDVNYANLLHGQPFLNAVHLRGTELSLPLNPRDPASPRCIVSNINASVLLPPHQIYLSRCEADFYGIHLSATGRLIHPDALAPPGPRTADKPPFIPVSIGQKILDTLVALRARPVPRITLRFSGDLRQVENLFIETTLEAGRLQFKNLALRSLEASLELRERKLRLLRLHAADDHGAFSLEGTLDTSDGNAAFLVRSTLDPKAVTAALGIPSPLASCDFYRRPLIEAAGRARFANGSSLQATGRLQCGPLAVKSVPLEGLAADFALDGPRWFLSGIQLRHRSGRCLASAMHQPGDFRARLNSNVDLRALQPFTSGKTSEMLGEWEFFDMPRLRLTLSGTGLDPAGWSGTGHVQLGRTTNRGVPLNQAEAQIEIKNRAVTYRDFRIARDEGTATGTFTYDFATKMVRLHEIKSSLIPTDVAMWIEPKIVKDLLPYRFRGPPQLSANGVVQTNGDEKTDLVILAEAPRGMDYVFLSKNLPFTSATGRLHFLGGQLRLENISGKLFNGTVRTDAVVSLKKEKPGYSGRIAVNGVDFESLTKLYFNYQGSRGRLDGAFDFRGIETPRSLRGTGSAQVTEGNVFAIPVFGPLSGILNSLVPGMGYNTARKASASFTVANGVIETNDFTVDGRGFVMVGGGKLHFLDDKIDFRIRINAEGLPGVFLFPVSKILEYGAEGTFSRPGWHPKIIPRLPLAR